MTKFLGKRRRFLATGVGFTLASLLTKTQAQEVSCNGMSRAAFDDYIGRFNNNDPRFVEFYHPDVVLELGSTSITTAQGIADFYANVKKHIREELHVNWFVSDANGVAVEMTTTFTCFNDWEDSFWQRPLKKGEVYRASGFVHYEVEGGLFKHIKSARYKVINEWRMENA